MLAGLKSGLAGMSDGAGRAFKPGASDEHLDYTRQASLAWAYLALSFSLAGIFALRGVWLGQPWASWGYLLLFWWAAAFSYLVIEYVAAATPTSKAGLCGAVVALSLVGASSYLWPSGNTAMALAPTATAGLLLMLLILTPYDERILRARFRAGAGAYVLLATMVAADLLTRLLAGEPTAHSLDLFAALAVSVGVAAARFRGAYGWSAEDVDRLWRLMVRAAMAVAVIGLVIERRPAGGVLFGLVSEILLAKAFCSWVRRRAASAVEPAQVEQAGLHQPD